MDVVVKKSNIDKKGVIANKKFKKGEVVLSWNPIKLPKSEIKKLSDEDKHYLFREKGVDYLMQPPERYVNHSCEANTKPMNMKDVAIKDIEKGEEITSDYGDDSSVSFVCKCGSKKCRGFIKSK